MLMEDVDKRNMQSLYSAREEAWKLHRKKQLLGTSHIESNNCAANTIMLYVVSSHARNCVMSSASFVDEV
jgi:hypothetical protein